MEGQKSILVIDDQKEILGLVSRTLELEGFDVAVATDGKTGLDLMAEHRPDLVILDIMMPGLNGFEVLDLIRQRSDVPVIMLSAIGEMPTMCDALQLGADDYVKKPFGTREFVARIQAKLRRVGFQDQQANNTPVCK
jgi:two-component system response regulator AdeR